MMTCRLITRAGRVLLAAGLLAMGGCGLLTSGEITPTTAISDLEFPPADTQELTDQHFVMNWLLLGPFTFGPEDFGGAQQQAAADKEFMPDEACLNGTQTPPAPIAWAESQQIFTSPNGDGRVVLDKVYRNTDHAAVYAVAWVNCPHEIADAKLLVGSDDYLTVWVNGEMVFSYNVRRRVGAPDQDLIERITLKKGYNRIVVKCVDVIRGWNFYLRLTDKDFKAIPVKPRPAAPCQSGES